MPRHARVIAPGLPHHITQRGNHRQRTFLRESDYGLYLRTMRQACDRHGVEIWAYCLMPNHVHLIAVPDTAEGLSLAMKEAHQSYTSQINLREGWVGHLWQGRFASFVMDQRYLVAAARYIELNPVQAEMVKSPWEYPWSSARANLTGRGDALVRSPKLLEIVQDWKGLLESGIPENERSLIEAHAKSGKPLAGEELVGTLERKLGRSLRPAKRGRRVGSFGKEKLVSVPN